MDRVLERVDAAVDEGNKALGKQQSPIFSPGQVRLFPDIQR